jgi:DNA polymerase III sliding clamp (beta) subunit (PCNA family)
MKFKISTANLNRILAIVIKGAGNKHTLPITKYFALSLSSNTLIVTATNGVNFISYIEPDVHGEDGYAVVAADQLVQLVKRTTKPEIAFASVKGHLEVKGNGKYSLPLYTFSEGESYPSYEFDEDAAPFEVNAQILKKALKVNESAIATNLIIPYLAGYNIGGQLITTDGLKMCVNESVFVDPPMLVSQQLADLLQMLTAEKVTVQKDENKLLFTTDNIVIFGAELDGLKDYPDITGVLGFEYDNVVTVSKVEFTNALDRLKLFTDPNDNNSIIMTFAKKGLLIEDSKKSSQEVVAIQEGPEYAEFSVTVNIELLTDLIDVLVHPVVKIEFGENLPLKITENDVTLTLGVIGDDEEEEDAGEEE